MRRGSPLPVAAGLFIALSIGFVAGSTEPLAAKAQDPVVVGDSAAATPKQKCRLFQLQDLEHDRDLLTSDRTSEIGQWVGTQEDAGWLLYSIDFEVGQKATGYPLGLLYVCMSPRG